MHTPVLLQQVIEGLMVKPDGKYIDATLGEGGHSLEIIKNGGKVLAIDADKTQINKAILRITDYGITNITFVHGNFAEIEKIAKENNFYPVDGVLFDLGLSMNQINEGKKGLSYRKSDESLDMRLNLETTEPAKDVIRVYNEDSLYEIFSRFSEDLNSRLIAKTIVEARKKKSISTVGDLMAVINTVVKNDNNRSASRIFQALRIFVNKDLDNLIKGLEGAMRVINKGGRIVVICFHSLEDRVVKKFIKNNRLKQINKKIITGDQRLKFERSAKLRVISN